MAKQANGERTIRAPLSAIITDPKVRAAFERSERDQGPEPLATVIIDPRRPLPSLGAEERTQIEGDIDTLLGAASRLIAVLDAADGDCEDEGAEHDGREPDVDDEPSLGWTLSGHLGGSDDREQDCEDEGADEGAECYNALARYIPPTKGDVRAAKAVRGFIQRVKRNGKLGAKVAVTAICIPAQEHAR